MNDANTRALNPRIATLDTIRGVAVMGILLMNVVAFAMPEVAYFNPAAFGSRGPADYVIWAVNFVLIDGKMRGLFSFLFGASLLLVVERAEAKGENPAKVHYARMAWLLLFGFAHLYLIWWGDILQHYAVIGILAFVFRKAAPHQLVAGAVILLVVQTALVSGLPWDVARVLTAPQTSPAAIASAQGYIDAFGKSSAATLARDIATHRGNYATLFAYRRHDEAAPLPTLLFVGVETLAYMLLGMAGLKSGMLTGSWTRATYRRWIAIGFGIGVPYYAMLALLQWRSGFDPFSVALSAITLSTPVRPLMIAGWVALIVLLMRPAGRLTLRLAAAGRMAFTNYLVTSLICTTLFYGYGLGWYGQLSRWQLYLVVLGIWALMLGWSKPWLAHFRFGPFEWLWRSLARWQRQPMRGAAP